MPWGLTPAHLIIILVIVLIVVGPGKLPETGAAIGKALRGFKDAVDTGEAGPSATQQQAVPPAQPLQPQAPVYPQPQYAPQQTYTQAPYQPPISAQPYPQPDVQPAAVQPAPFAPADQPSAPQVEPPHQG